MSICLSCQTYNQAGARFCKQCGEPLPEIADESQPMAVEMDLSRPSTSGDDITLEGSPDEYGHTRPLDDIPVFASRPPGAIFDDRFMVDRLIFTSEIEHRYVVLQIGVSEESLFRVCSNPDCGAIAAPEQSGVSQYCVDCGSLLNPAEPELVLIETMAPISDKLAEIVEKGLSHGSIRAPLAFFDETFADEHRFCLVMPHCDRLKERPEMLQALNWGIKLARGLDYLHANGISFGGQVAEVCFGLVGDRAVWADFNSCEIVPSLSAQERRSDVRSLATQLLRWLTVQPQYDYDPNIGPGINRLLEQALALPGFSSGLELAQSIEQALDEISVPMVNFRSGWRTHVGMERTLNEDSLLTVEVNNAQQFFSQSVGIYVVADGMGGHSSGEVASGTIIHAIAEKISSDLTRVQTDIYTEDEHLQWLREVVTAANQAVFNLRKSAGMDMGSTLVIMMLHANKAYVAHVGDSRAYVIDSHGIQQITTDHSLVERLVATQMITREEARSHPHRNVVYRVMGGSPNLDVDVSVYSLKEQDRLLLCTDGLNGMLDDQEIRDIVMQANSPQAACDALVAAANVAGGKDNITAVVVEVFSPLMPDGNHKTDTQEDA